MDDYEVVINGGGPVGMGLAIELGQRGHRVAVVERHPTPQPVPKGQNLTQRTLEHMHAWGCEAAMRAARTIPPEAGQGGMSAWGTLLSPWHHDWYQRAQVRPYYFTDNDRLPQYATEAVLRARVADLPSVAVLYGWAGTGLTVDASGATLDIAAEDGAAPRGLRGRYLVGCDGSHSLVRGAAGITETRRDHDRRMVLLVFRAPGLDALLARYPGKQFYNVLDPRHDGYWQFFGRVDMDGTWFFHCPVPADTTAGNTDFAALLHRVVGAEFDVDFRYVGFWDLRIAIADAYRAGPVFIAGDAAHSHPPYGGYGINTGFEDARNLGWKLAARLQGWGGEALLDSYDAERRPVFASTARDFIERFIEEDRAFLRTYHPDRDAEAFARAWAARSEATGPVTAFEPNYRGSPVVSGGPGGSPSAVGSHVMAARAGHHLPPITLSDGRNVYQAFGPGFTLIALDAPEADVAALAAAAAGGGVPLTVLRDSRGGGRDAWEASLILVRPDSYVAWTGTRADDAEALIARVAGRG